MTQPAQPSSKPAAPAATAGAAKPFRPLVSLMWSAALVLCLAAPAVFLA